MNASVDDSQTVEKPSTPLDINTIPYDAPLSITEPTPAWTRQQANKGYNGKFLTLDDIHEVDLRGKWVVISGGNNGIGRDAALQMSAWGANLVLACRQPPSHELHPDAVVEECKQRAVEAGHSTPDIEWWEVDMSSLASVEAFAKRWLDTGRPLDVLCNNAGIGSTPKPRPFKTNDGFEIIHQVNFLSHVLLTLRLLPSLAKASAPRIVCSTSCFHYLGKFDLGNWNGEKLDAGREGVQYYMNNKLNFQTWLTELQHRLRQHKEYSHIVINGVHPGYVASGIWNMNSPNWITTPILKAVAWMFGITPQQGSFAILNAVTSPEAGLNPEGGVEGDEERLGGGRYFNRIWEEEPMPHTKDRDCRMRVWRKANDELKLQEKGLLDVLGLQSKD